MKDSKTKATGLILAIVIFISCILPTGCNVNNEKDIDAIKEVTEQFISAFGSGDPHAVTDCVENGFSYHIINQDLKDILFKISSKTEILSFENIETDRKSGKAKAGVKISYIDISTFSNDMTRTKGFMNAEEYLEAVDGYASRQEMTLEMQYMYRKYEHQWVVKVTSADKYMELFEQPHFLNVIEYSSGDAEDEILNVFEQFAKGNFATSSYTLDIDRLRVFDGSFNSKVTEAIKEFGKAYFQYVIDHGITFEKGPDNPYKITVRGHVPSKEAMLEYISSDELYMEKAKTQIKWQFFIDGDEAWNNYFSGIYYYMAEHIKDMPSDDYSFEVTIDPWADELSLKVTGLGFFPLKYVDFYKESQLPEEGWTELSKAAAADLYKDGVINKEQYDSYVAAIEYGFDFDHNGRGQYQGDTYSRDWKGTDNYTNQAFSVVEEYPSAATGYFYGDSMPDRNGFIIHYSRHSGYINNVGYHVDGNSITFMYVLTYDKFSAGMEFSYDWNITGDGSMVSETYTVNEDGQRIVEITLTDISLEDGQSLELYLYSVKRQDVMSYVRLTQT